MSVKVISQRRFLRGLNAVAPDIDTPPGSVPRLSNLNFKRRGALSTIDGSLIISTNTLGIAPNSDSPITGAHLYLPTNAANFYVLLKKDRPGGLTHPTGLVLSKVAGGALTAGTYFYQITFLDGESGETDPSAEASITLTAGDIAGGTKTIHLAWTTEPNALNVGGTNIYRSATTGTETLLATQASGITFNDTGAVSPNGQTLVPLFNGAETHTFYNVPLGGYTLPTNVIKYFPADAIPILDGGGGGKGSGGYGGGGAGSSSGQKGTVAGGLAGNTGSLPQIVPFVNKMILCLGNGFAPQLSDGTTGGTSALTNSFVTSYPDWIASTSFNAGDIILPTAGNAGGFVFQAKQAGKTGGAHPTWPQTLNVTAADGSVIWVNTGQTSTSPAPIGAAHGIVHAGSLWLANTSPTNDANGLDGPSALRMSDINNPLSWNPLNAAFLGKDDGTQIQGVASFTIAEAGIPPTGTLVVFKDFTTYQITGVFGSSTFAIQQVQTDMGCIAPRSIQYLPGFGIARLTHLGIAVFDGVRDRLISEEIRPYIFGGVADITPMDWNFAYFSKGTETSVPPQYALAVPTLIGTVAAPSLSLVNFPNFLSLGTWFVRLVQVAQNGAEVAVAPEVSISLPDATHGIQVIGPALPAGALKWRLYFSQTSGSYFQFLESTDLVTPGATVISTVTNVGSPRLAPLNRIFTYDLVLKAWTVADLPFPVSLLRTVVAQGTIPITLMGGHQDGSLRRWQAGDATWDGTAVAWSVRTPEVFGANPTDPVYFRRLLIRGIVAAGSTANLTVTVNVEGTNQPSFVMKEIDLGSGEFEAWIDIGLTGLNANATVTGSGIVELDAFDWHAQPKPSGAFRSII